MLVHQRGVNGFPVVLELFPGHVGFPLQRKDELERLESKEVQRTNKSEVEMETRDKTKTRNPTHTSVNSFLY